MYRPRPRVSLALAMTFAIGAGCEKEATTTPDEKVADEAHEADEADLPEEEEPEEAPAEDADAPSTLTVYSFEEAMQTHYQDVVDCYMTALETKADLKGKMTLSFAIGEDGKVTGVTVVEGSTLSDEGLVACVGDKAQAWEFDKPKDGVTSYDFPFNLEPG